MSADEAVLILESRLRELARTDPILSIENEKDITKARAWLADHNASVVEKLEAIRKLLTTVQSAAVLGAGIQSGRSHTPTEDAGLIAARCDVAILVGLQALGSASFKEADLVLAQEREAYAYQDSIDAITKHYFPWRHG